jgi:carbon storage regulator
VLIVRRRRGEVIVIGDGVEIEILDISPTQVKVGIRAPKEIAVFRKEIRLAREANVAAANAPSTEILQNFVGRLRTNDIRTNDNGQIGDTSEPAASPEIRSAHLPG